MNRGLLAGLALAGLAMYAAEGAGAGAPAGNEATMIARGRFDVKMSPQPQDDHAGGPFGRYFLDKQFQGDLQATSRGQMLASGTGAEQSGAYVALELVTGTLHGRQGSFVLQHRGTMHKGATSLDVSVVPGSGTAELAGIGGTMTIVIAGREHSYELKYTFDSR